MVNHTGAALLRALKNAEGPTLVLPVGAPPVALLRPVVTATQRLHAPDVERLTDWRNRHVHSFLSEFRATDARTANWLTQVVGPRDNKVLFMVDLLDGRTVGYMGIDYIDWKAGKGEADAIVRGEPAPHGLMKQALQTLLTWAREALGLGRLNVRVLSDNPALTFYEKVGFVPFDRVPLRRVQRADAVEWVEDAANAGAPRQLVYLTWKEQAA